MAMEKHMVLRDIHTRSITAIGYNPARREIAIGCQDGAVRCWEVDSGKLTQSSNEHIGWVTDFLYWTDPKLLFSSANDGLILVWAASGGITDKIHLGAPVYSMAINFRWHQLLCGSKAGIRVYGLDEGKRCGHVINQNVLHVAKQHTDIVRSILCHESRIYSAGFDHHFIIYDSSYKNNGKLYPMLINYNAHDAGITCMVLARDSELNFWVVTGSFDKSVRIWSIDGKPIHRMNNFLAPVSSLCYCPRDKTIWVTAGLSSACLFEPKSGDNVTESLGTFQQQDEEKYHLQIVKFVPELNEVVGSTSRKHVILWKYNSCGCVTALKARHPMESLCYTSKTPILFFSGGNEGTITKWERMQSNFFIYSKEEYLLKNAQREETKVHGMAMEKEQHRHSVKGRKSLLINKMKSAGARAKSAIMKLTFVESLDLLVTGCEDGNIYVWGFDMAAAEQFKKVELEKEVNLAESKFAALLDPSSVLLRKVEDPFDSNDTVNKRVADFICQHILLGHQGSVTSLIVIDGKQGYNGAYLISAGWDRKLRIWNLETGELHDTYHHGKCSTSGASVNTDIICDGVILDMDYSPTLKEIGYATSESLAYIRKFSLNGSEMTLQNTLSGHRGDVVAIRWHPTVDKWVTGGEDGTIRIWSSTGLNECEQVLSTQGVIYCLTIDEINGSIVTGVQNTIKVFDINTYCTVQVNVGHTDVVKGVIHVPQRNQYVSCSWDQTVRVWNAWKQKVPRQVEKSEVEDSSQL